MRALSDLDPHAWITGRRRSQGGERAQLPLLELDDGRLKINPLANWTLQQVWHYLRTHSIPYNPLHDKGYASIGDLMNTRPLKPGEIEREGRFMYSGMENRTECGLHQHKARADAMRKAAESEGNTLKLPHLPCDACLDLQPDTFEKHVMRAVEDVLIEFYSPLCGHCQDFAPKYAEVARRWQALKGSPAVRMDIFTHDIPQAGKDAGFILHAYPTIYLARPNSTSGKFNLSRYEGLKDVSPLIEWLKSQLDDVTAM